MQIDYGKPMVTVWRLRGTRPPAPVPAQVKQCEIYAWALFVDGTRARIGTTVFLTELAAQRRWQGELDRMRKDGYTQRFHRSIAEKADALCTVNVYKKGRR